MFSRLEFERRLRDWSQFKAAQEVGGITQQELSLVEQGRLRPRPNQLARLGRVFGVEPASLLLAPLTALPADDDRRTESREMAR